MNGAKIRSLAINKKKRKEINPFASKPRVRFDSGKSHKNDPPHAKSPQIFIVELTKVNCFL